MARKNPVSVINIALRTIDETKKGYTSATKGAEGLQRSLKVLGHVGAAAGAAVAGSFTVIAAKLISSRQEMAEFSDRIGITVENLSRLKFAAEQSGVGFRELQTSLQRMTRRVAEGSQSTDDALKQLGVSLESLKRLRAGEQFRLIAQGFDSIEDPGQRAAVAMKLFDTEGVKLLQILGNGSAGLEQMVQQADALGVTMSGSSAKAVQRMNESLGILKGVVVGLVNQFLEGFLPALNALAQPEATSGLAAMQQALRWVGERVGDVIHGFGFLMKSIKDLAKSSITIFKLWVDAVSSLIKAVASLLIGFIKDSFFNAINEVFKQLNNVVNRLPKKVRGFLGLDSAIPQIQFDTSNTEIAQERLIAAFGKIDHAIQTTGNNANATFASINKRFKAMGARLLNSRLVGLEPLQASGKPLNVPGAPGVINPPGVDTGSQIQTMNDYMTEYGNNIKEVNQSQTQLYSGLQSSGENALASWIDVTNKTKVSFASMGKSMVSTLSQVIAKLIVANILTKSLGFFGGFFGGGGSIAAGAGGLDLAPAFAGIAHGGLSRVPKEGTYLLDKDERVLSPSQNEDFTEFMREFKNHKTVISIDGYEFGQLIRNNTERGLTS